MKATRVLGLLILLLVVLNVFLAPVSSSTAQINDVESRVNALLAKMSLEEKLGQFVSEKRDELHKFVGWFSRGV